MNIWTKRSMDLLYKSNYFDKLESIYPISINSKRVVPKKIIVNIKKFYKAKNGKALFDELKKLKKFPIDDSYISSFKKHPEFVKNNPKCMKKIYNKIFSYSLAELLYECTKPVSSSKQLGSMFKKWILTNPFNVSITDDFDTFLKSKKFTILTGSDKKLLKFSVKYLGYNKNKGVDFICKNKNTFVLAEAKFITAIGGSQNNQFTDAIDSIEATCTNPNNFKIKQIAIVDGYPYIKADNKIHKYLVNNNDKIILSALLLKNFVKSIK